MEHHVTAAPSTTGDSTFEPLAEQVRAAMQRYAVPGVAVGILHEGQEYVAGFGVTNVNNPSPVSGKTLFQIGSITKTITATVVVRLVELGKLDLDTPLSTYLPDLRLADSNVAERVTLRHLLTHTAGWEGDLIIGMDTGRGDDALTKLIARLPEIPQLSPLGELWAYNNAAFCLAGRVIEVVTGTTYEAATRELVLDPLGMRHSLFFPEEVMLHSFAVGHNVVENKAEVTRPWPIPRSSNPAGGIAAPAPDLLRYARFEMGDGQAEDGTPPLSRASLDLMQTPALDASDGQRVGLSWFIQEIEGVRLIGHGGGTNGQISTFQFAPDRGFALALLTNANRGGELILDVSKWAFKQYLGVEEPEVRHLSLAPGEAEQYLGHYAATLSTIDLTVRDGVVMLQVTPAGKGLGDERPPTPPPSPVAFYAPDKFVGLEGGAKDARGEFLRHPDGSIAWLRIGGRLYKREQ